MLKSQTSAGTRAQLIRRGPPPRPTTARQSPAGLVISALFHAGLLAATYFTWSRMVDLSPESHAIPVELVVAEQTNIRAEAPPEESKLPEKPVMVEPQLPAFRDVEPAPLPPVPQIVIQKPTPVDQPNPPKTKKQIVADADAVLNKILAQAARPKNAVAGPKIIQGQGNQSLATADLADALKSQIYRCWHPTTVGAPNANDLVVDLEMQLNADGSVANRPQLSATTQAAMGNPYTRAAAEAAVRAVYECAPYNLPAKRYSDWRDINLRFDPREMMNQ